MRECMDEVNKECSLVIRERDEARASNFPLLFKGEQLADRLSASQTEADTLRTQLAAAEALNGRLREALTELLSHLSVDSSAYILVKDALALPVLSARGKEGEK